MKVAEAINQALLAEGVRLAAGITGQSVGHLTDALATSPDVKICYTRQERVAVDICDGFARVTGAPGVVFSDSGPSAGNTMGGIVNSFGDSIPVLFMAGQNDRFEVEKRYTKELRIREVFGPVSKWVSSIQDGSQIEHVLRRAFVHLRSGRRGPVVIEMPFDVSSMQVENFTYSPILDSPPIRSAGDPRLIDEAVRMLAVARRPYVYVGAGVLAAGVGATEALVELAELLTLPVATTLNGKSAFPEDHPLSLGIGGFSKATYGTSSATKTAREADVVLTIGCGFKRHATREPMPPGVSHIQVDLDASELHREARVDLPILGDAELVLRQMVESARSLLPKQRFEPVQETLTRIAGYKQEWDALCEPLLTSNEHPINPFRVTAELRKLVDPAETIVLHDAGSVRGSTSQHYPATRPKSFIGFGVESALGWSLGAAIGARVAEPDKLVVAVMGDEALQETGLDIETSVRSNTPVLLLVKNNRADPDRDGGSSPRLASVRFKPVADFCLLAQSLGAHASRVDDPEMLAPVLAEAIAQVKDGRTALVDITTRRVATSLHGLWDR